MKSTFPIERAADAVRRALASYPPFRHAASEINIKSSAAGLELHGFVRSEAVAHSALALARVAAGGVTVANKLTADNILEAGIAQRLAADAVTAAYPVRVNAYLGRVTLVGVLPAAARKKALEIVQGLPGVRSAVWEDMVLTPAAQPVTALLSAITASA